MSSRVVSYHLRLSLHTKWSSMHRKRRGRRRHGSSERPLKSITTFVSNMETGHWKDSLIVLWRNMLHLLWKALDGHYQGLRETPGVTVLSQNVGIPLSPAVRSLVPPNKVLWWRGVSVSMASETQTAWEIRDGTQPWFSVDPTYQQQINTLGHGNACMRTIWTRVCFNEAAK